MENSKENKKSVTFGFNLGMRLDWFLAGEWTNKFWLHWEQQLTEEKESSLNQMIHIFQVKKTFPPSLGSLDPSHPHPRHMRNWSSIVPLFLFKLKIPVRKRYTPWNVAIFAPENKPFPKDISSEPTIHFEGLSLTVSFRVFWSRQSMFQAYGSTFNPSVPLNPKYSNEIGSQFSWRENLPNHIDIYIYAYSI